MPVEVDCYALKRTKDAVLNTSFVVQPGSSENITFLRYVRLVVFLDVDNTRARVHILGQKLNKHVEARIYQPLDDVEGTRVSVENPIEVSIDELLAISLKQGRREVSIYFVVEDNDQSDFFEDDPVNFPDDTRPLVKV